VVIFLGKMVSLSQLPRGPVDPGGIKSGCLGAEIPGLGLAAQVGLCAGLSQWRGLAWVDLVLGCVTSCGEKATRRVSWADGVVSISCVIARAGCRPAAVTGLWRNYELEN
jgi:hypothetical protein